MNTINKIKCYADVSAFEADLSSREFSVDLCRIVSNEAVNAEYMHMRIEAPKAATIAKAGQFFHLTCPSIDANPPYLRRPMSIYEMDRAAGQIGFLYKVAGKGTRGLAQLRAGARIDILGPLGRGFDFPAGCRHILQIARGVGLATLAPVAAEAQARGIRITAVLSMRSPDLAMSVEMLRAQGAEVILVNDFDGSSAIETLGPRLDRLIGAQGVDFIVTCGSSRLLALAQDLAQRHAITGQVALEEPMGCGIGMCFACVRSITLPNGDSTYKRVCWDGPVFSLAEVASW